MLRYSVVSCLLVLNLIFLSPVCMSVTRFQASDIDHWFKQVFYTNISITLDHSLLFGSLAFRFQETDFIVHFTKDTSLNAISSVTVGNSKDILNISNHVLLYRSFAAEPNTVIVSAAIIKLMDDGLDAVIHTDTQIIYVEPACRYKLYREPQASVCATEQPSLHRIFNSIVYTEDDAKDVQNLTYRQALFDRLYSNIIVNNKTDENETSRRRRSIGNKICSLNIVADYHFYVERGRSDILATTAEMAYFVREADIIFRGTDFDGDGAGDNIGFHIANVQIYDQPNTYKMYSISDVGDYLYAFAEYQFDDYCLSVAFTSKDFDGGVIGLAWVANSNIYGAPGGLCQTRITYSSMQYNLNTCLVTTKNSGEHMPTFQTSLVLTHELGHNFGSPHDDTSNSACVPNDDYGNYLMYPYAADGTQPNNIDFSRCSIDYMYPVILNKGGCFKNAIEPVCGNSFREYTEMCDCGSIQTCSRIDVCCTPSDVPESDPDAPCTIRYSHGNQCSPKVSPCCTSACLITPAGDNNICRMATDCTQAAVCNGLSAECPELSMKPNGTKCHSGTRTCQGGKCIGSVCLAYGLEPCSEGQDCECKVCCKSDASACSLRLDNYFQPIPRPVGTLCDDRKGYCNPYGVCIMQSPDGALDRFSQVFSQDEFDEAKEWFKKYWYYVALSIGFLVLLIVIFVKTCRANEHIHTHAFMYGQLSKIQREADIQKQYLQTRRDEVKKGLEEDIAKITSGSRNMEITKAIARMIVFFPTVPRPVLIQTMTSSGSEEFAVRSLLMRGYPFRRICDGPVI